MTNENQPRKGIEEMSEIGNDCMKRLEETEAELAKWRKWVGSIPNAPDIVDVTNAQVAVVMADVAVKQAVAKLYKVEDRVRELEAENKRLRDVLQTLTSDPKEVYIGVAYIEFSKRLLPEHAQEILDLAWPKGEKG